MLLACSLEAEPEMSQREEVAKMHCEVEMSHTVCTAGQVTTVLANYRNEWMGATAHWVVLCAGGWAVAVPS